MFSLDLVGVWFVVLLVSGLGVIEMFVCLVLLFVLGEEIFLRVLGGWVLGGGGDKFGEFGWLEVGVRFFMDRVLKGRGVVEVLVVEGVFFLM